MSSFNHSSQQQQRNNSRMMNLNNASMMPNYGNSNERNGGGGGGFGTNSDNNEFFESWACEKPFNLLEYIGGDDSSPLDDVDPHHGHLDEDELQKQKEDALYSQLQYSDMMMVGEHHPHLQQPQHNLHDHSQNQNNSDFGIGNEFGNNGHHDHFDHVPSSAGAAILNSSNSMVYQQNLDAIPHVPSTSRSSLPMLSAIPPEVKQEPASEQEQAEMKVVFAPGPSRESSVASSIQTTMTVTTATSPGPSTMGQKPRKYRIKPDSEKANPMYKMKRAKNNDAVRRSRDKAKRIQEAKENELKFLQDDNRRKAEIIETLKVTNAQLQRENTALKQSCRCGARISKR